MSYKTDGSSHYTGIQSEKHLREYLASGVAEKLYGLTGDYSVIKRGGTLYKQDIEIVRKDQDPILISVKKKENKETGSFDWVNTTNLISKIPALNKFSKRVKEIGESGVSYGQAYIDRKQASLDCLSCLTSKDIKTILKREVLDKNTNMRIMIRDLFTNTVWEFGFNDLPLYRSIKYDTPYLDIGRGTESSKIMFRRKNGTIVDHNLRIRIVDNNGISALLGLSKSNKSSIACIKIQQENVGELIESLGNKKRKL